MHCKKAFGVVTVACFLSFASPLTVKGVHAQKPTMDADGVWTCRFDIGVDGKVHRDVRETELILAVRNDKITGRVAAASGQQGG